MVHSRNHIWTKTIRQVFFIALITMAAGIVSNFFRSDKIPFVEYRSSKSTITTPSGESLVIPFPEAESLFKQGKATFIDARSGEEYDAGHIKGAVSLPYKEADSKFVEVMSGISEERAIITYCDGQTCELSTELALFLRDTGYKNVKILSNGWTVWKQKGLPVETGKQ